MSKRNYFMWPTIIGVALALGIFIGGKLNFTDNPERLFSTNSKKDKINRLIDYIDYEYVDDINTDSIVDVTVTNILEKLDPHSVYIPKKDMQEVAENMKGDFVGIGVNFYMYKDTVTVIKTVLNGPSDQTGIMPGDRIMKADNDTLFGKSLPSAQIVEKLKGVKDSKVVLNIFRKKDSSFF
jgi:carboxyl-terminal processing protease